MVFLSQGKAIMRLESFFVTAVKSSLGGLPWFCGGLSAKRVICTGNLSRGSAFLRPSGGSPVVGSQSLR
jgi:phosphoglucomutase